LTLENAVSTSQIEADSKEIKNSKKIRVWMWPILKVRHRQSSEDPEETDKRNLRRDSNVAETETGWAHLTR
jgi:hypothetical protein